MVGAVNVVHTSPRETDVEFLNFVTTCPSATLSCAEQPPESRLPLEPQSAALCFVSRKAQAGGRTCRDICQQQTSCISLIVNARI